MTVADLTWETDDRAGTTGQIVWLLRGKSETCYKSKNYWLFESETYIIMRLSVLLANEFSGLGR
jgi:hypothetical protein